MAGVTAYRTPCLTMLLRSSHTPSPSNSSHTRISDSSERLRLVGRRDSRPAVTTGFPETGLPDTPGGECIADKKNKRLWIAVSKAKNVSPQIKYKCMILVYELCTWCVKELKSIKYWSRLKITRLLFLLKNYKK